MVEKKEERTEKIRFQFDPHIELDFEEDKYLLTQDFYYTESLRRRWD